MERDFIDSRKRNKAQSFAKISDNLLKLLIKILRQKNGKEYYFSKNQIILPPHSKSQRDLPLFYSFKKSHSFFPLPSLSYLKDKKNNLSIENITSKLKKKDFFFLNP